MRNRESHQSLLGDIVLLFLLLFLFTLYSGGESGMVGPSQPIRAQLGDDVILPCRLAPCADAVHQTLEWARQDLNPRFVYLRRDGVELLVHQNPAYVGRTSVLVQDLEHGDVSLRLTGVRVSDGGTYRCNVPTLGATTVQLVVASVPPVVSIVLQRPEDQSSSDDEEEEVVVQCSSGGWYPEPEVLWLDGEGQVLSAGPPETVRGPDDLYTVSSRVTVEKRHSNSFTCRVHQKDTNLTRDTTIRIKGEVLMDPACPLVRVLIVVFSVLLMFSAAASIISCRPGNKKRRHEAEGGSGEEGEQLLILRGTGTKLQEKEEETKELIQVIEVLSDRKEDLEEMIEDKMLKLQKVKGEMMKIEKKLQSVGQSFTWDQKDKETNLFMNKLELENRQTKLEKSIETLKEKLQKTVTVIRILTERRTAVEKQVDQMKKMNPGDPEEKTETSRDESEEKHQPETQEETETGTWRPAEEMKPEGSTNNPKKSKIKLHFSALGKLPR